MQAQVLVLVSCFILFALVSAGEGNFVPILIIVRFSRMIFWLEIVRFVNDPTSDSDDYFEWTNTLNQRSQSIEMLRLLVYLIGYIGFLPYDLAAYRSISFIILRISVMAGISYLINILKLLSFEQKTPALMSHHLWLAPMQETIYITLVDFFVGLFFSPWIEFFIHKS